jgi:glycosyltransferase involved in cell wall biosynthesis
MLKEAAVIIPVYNEGPVIKKVVDSVLDHFPTVVCVNDGSKDNSGEEIAKTNALLIQHPVNMGQGAALQTGIDFALQIPGIKYFITFDADGQHNIKDVVNMLEILKKDEVDIVMGSRFLGEVVNMSFLKKIILKLAIKFTNLFSGVNLTDTHNGLRVFNRKFAVHIDITMPGMAHASEIIDKMGRGGWRYLEVPVTISYTEHSVSKGQPMLNSVNILMDVLLSRTRR